MVQFNGLLPGLLQKMHTPSGPKGSAVPPPPHSPEQKIKCKVPEAGRLCVHLLQRELLGLLQTHP